MFALKLNKTDTFWRTTVNYSTKFEDFANMCVFPNFYPNLPIFVHGCISHIRDISLFFIFNYL